MNGDTTIHSPRTFDTGQGQVNLNGNVQIADGKTLTVGSANTGAVSASDTVIWGSLTVGGGGNAQATSLTVHGSLTQNDDADGTAKTFTSASGANTLRGDVSIAVNKFLHMDNTGTGTFTTGTGAISLNGHTLIASGKTFDTGAGAAVKLDGPTQVTDPYTFEVGDPLQKTPTGPTSVTKLHGALTVGSVHKTMAAGMTLYGDFIQYDDQDTAIAHKTFTTASGNIALGGNVALAHGADLLMDSTGAGVFTTGTGAVNLNGDVTIAGGKTLTLNTGVIACDKDGSTGQASNTYCFATR